MAGRDRKSYHYVDGKVTAAVDDDDDDDDDDDNNNNNNLLIKPVPLAARSKT